MRTKFLVPDASQLALLVRGRLTAATVLLRRGRRSGITLTPKQPEESPLNLAWGTLSLRFAVGDGRGLIGTYEIRLDPGVFLPGGRCDGADAGG